MAASSWPMGKNEVGPKHLTFRLTKSTDVGIATPRRAAWHKFRCFFRQLKIKKISHCQLRREGPTRAVATVEGVSTYRVIGDSLFDPARSGLLAVVQQNPDRNTRSKADDEYFQVAFCSSTDAD